MFGFMLYSFTLTIIDDFKTDSRIVAESWIQQNIVFNSSTTFGTNEGCSGDSPATKTGKQFMIQILILVWIIIF